MRVKIYRKLRYDVFHDIPKSDTVMQNVSDLDTILNGISYLDTCQGTMWNGRPDPAHFIRGKGNRTCTALEKMQEEEGESL